MVKNNYRYFDSLKIFIVLVSFSGSLAPKCISLNDVQCKTRPTFIDLNSRKETPSP